MEQYWPWIGFHIFVFIILGLDLFVFHKDAHVVKIREALIWSAFCVALAMLFNLGVYYFKGPTAGLEFLTGYLLEESLSVDNLFVFLTIFSAFGIPNKLQHRVLFWGLGECILR